MDYFKYFIKCIFRKVPLKVLFILIIFLLLCLICFNANVFAATEEYYYNDVLMKNYMPNIFLDFIYSTDEYLSGEYYYFCGGNTYENYCNIYFIPKISSPGLYRANYNNDYYSGYYFTNNVQHCVYYSVFVNPQNVVQINNNKIIDVSLGTYWVDHYNHIYYPSATPPYYVFEIYTNLNIYSDSSLSNIFYQGIEVISPHIVNTTDIDTWSFDNLYISLGTVPYRWTEDGIGYEPTWWELEIIYQENSYSIRLDNYIYEQERNK